MYVLSNTTGPVGYGEAPGKTGNSSTSSAGKDSDKKLIARANSVPILHIFKHYNMRFDLYTHKATCPFKAHKGGKEATPSFTLYEDTNMFKCFGCGIAGRATHFIVEMERCKPITAATRILQLFGTKVDDDLLAEETNPSERLEIMMTLSSRIFEFRQEHSDKHALDFIEYIGWLYDRSNARHKYDNESLRRLVEVCVELIDVYTPELILTLEKKYLNLI
jgi:CHC2 zinc finger